MVSKIAYDKLLQKLALNIKKYRNKFGWTQEEMTTFGFNYRYYQKLESGRHSPSLYTLYKLSKVFRIKLIELLK